MIEVAVGVIAGADGQYLLARRHADAHQGGLWEFPGGKVEAGEAVTAALARELEEELGILFDPTGLVPLCTVEHAYPEFAVRLHVWRVPDYAGEPQGLEGQALTSVTVTGMRELGMPPANRAIVRALSLPDRMMIAPARRGDSDAVLAGLEAGLASGHTACILCPDGMDRAAAAEFSRAVQELTRRWSARLIVDGDTGLAAAVAADGVNLPAARLGLTEGIERPDVDFLVGVACQTAEEVLAAAARGADYVLVEPEPAEVSGDGGPAPAPGSLGLLAWEAGRPVYAIGAVGSGGIRSAVRVLPRAQVNLAPRRGGGDD